MDFGVQGFVGFGGLGFWGFGFRVLGFWGSGLGFEEKTWCRVQRSFSGACLPCGLRVWAVVRDSRVSEFPKSYLDPTPGPGVRGLGFHTHTPPVIEIYIYRYRYRYRYRPTYTST